MLSILDIFSSSLVILYLGIIAWIISFDTYYALEDKNDDEQIGVNSTAILWGNNAIIYSKLEMKGFTRSEFIFVNNTPYFLEINSIPGMTHESILPKQLDKIGMTIQDIVNESLDQAIK